MKSERSLDTLIPDTLPFYGSRKRKSAPLVLLVVLIDI
jgi:hypothetical protein